MDTKVHLAVIPTLERARAGNTVARLGDPRFDPDLFYVAGEDLLAVAVPRQFWIGSDKQKDKDTYENEFPRHKVDLALYYLHHYPVTVAQFKAYVRRKTTCARLPLFAPRRGRPPGGWFYLV